MYLSVSRLFDLVRLLLLGISLLGLSLGLIWSYAPEAIDELDDRVVKTYTKDTRKRIKQAETLLSDSPREAVKSLRSLLKDLESIEKADRLGPAKRKAFTLLTGTLEREKDLRAALDWTRRWIVFDDRDLNAQIQEALLLYRIPESRSEGLAAMARIYGRLPELERVAATYAGMLYQEGEVAQAVSVYEAHMNNPARKKLSAALLSKTYLDHGGGFSEETRIRPPFFALGE